MSTIQIDSDFKSFPAYTISNYFIKKGKESNVELTRTKLLKLVYFAHGWFLGLTGKSLIKENIYAWKYGPVINELYNIYKHYHGSDEYFYTNPDLMLPYDKNIEVFLDRIWEVYSKYSPYQLSTISHETNSPWDTVWNEKGGKNEDNAIIDNELIKSYYSKLIRKE